MGLHAPTCGSRADLTCGPECGGPSALPGRPRPPDDLRMARTDSSHARYPGTRDDALAIARTEGQLANEIAPDGTPSAEIVATLACRPADWRTLQELALAA